MTHDDDDYWMSDFPLFMGKFPLYRHEERMVQGKVHLSDEPYFDVNHEIVPIRNPQKGERVYINMHPYVLEPELFMTVGLYPTSKHYADQEDAIGEVIKTDVKGMRQHQVGNSQAWYYPADKVIVVWECFLESSFRRHPLSDDPHMLKLWQAFEHWLYKQFPQATRIATPYNDPIAHTIEEYQAFLHTLNYHPSPTAKAAFEKLIK